MDLKEKIINRIKTYVNESNEEKIFKEPIIGFSSAQDPYYLKIKEIVGDHHIYPTEILPDAKTVISFFIPFENLIVESNRVSVDTSFEWADAYIKTNTLINKISDDLIKWHSEKNINAATVKATHTYDPEKLVSSWSHRSAAYIAGLGTFGINRLLITKVGCAGRYGSVIISESIQSTERPTQERCIQKQGGKCFECIKNCPTHALRVNDIDRHKCNNHLLKVDSRFPELSTCDVCGKCSLGPCAIL